MNRSQQAFQHPQEARALAELLREQQDDILERWKQLVSQFPSARGLEEPLLLDEIGGLMEELARHLQEAARPDGGDGDSPSQEARAAALHGIERLRVGFQIEEVVREYNLLRGLVFDAASDHIEFPPALLQLVNEVIDRSIATALGSYTRQHTLEEQRRRSEHIAFITHEMRHPLATIGAATKLLRDGRADCESQLPQMLQRSIDRLEGMIRQLIEESRQIGSDMLKESRPSAVPLLPLVAAIAAEQGPPAEQAGIELQVEVGEELAVWADPSLLDIVLANLVRNAIDHSGARRVEIGAQERGDQVTCWVEDDGRGIPPGRRAAIFEPYETRSESGQGRGVGLYIAKRFAEALNGTLAAEDPLTGDQGARFEVSLPKVRAE